MTAARDKFLKLLKDEILQMELAALDFGIYRILNFRRREIEDFLDRELPARIDAALATLPGAPTEDEQGRLFHHLYTFFSRYYDDGDFVTRPRRGRNAAYSVPYNGQDVHFWWATKGSHYVKSGERFASYVWKDGPRAIRIEVAQADIEKDNVKGAKRYYLPAAVDTTDDTLVIHLAYRPLDADEAKRFEKRKAADDQDDGDDAPEGRTTQERILNAWLDGNGPRKAKIPASVDKALLRKHVARYVAGQTSDLFVHPQLGEFLAGELDWYLKNEFLEIWDRADGDALARERGKLAVVRDIGQALIAFLAAIEDVQAQLFEKRKFVLASDWLARVSALPEGNAAQALVKEACASAVQVNEWLGWLGREPLKARALANATKHGVALLEEFPHLCIHTRHFEEGFKLRLLSLFDDIEAATGGVLVHSENYAALRTLEYAYRQRIKCIYIDPPYNTGKDGFAYKDALQHSSWNSMLIERAQQSSSLLKQDGALFASIDEVEQPSLRQLLNDVFGEENHVADMIWAAGRKNDSRLISVSHEYVIAYAKDRAHLSEAKNEWQQKKKGLDEIYAQHEKLKREHGDDYAAMSAGLKAWYNSLPNGHPSKAHKHYSHIDQNGIYFPADISWPGGGGPTYKVLHPVTKKPVKVPARGWMTSDPEKMQEWIKDGRVHFGADETSVPCIKAYLKDREYQAPYSVFYQDGRAATKRLRQLIGFDDFGYPKDETVIAEIIAMLGETRYTLDYFAGSGTTAHAVINLNREDGGTRKFVLVEQGEYFDTVLLPRVAKVIACPDWKDGQPKDGVAMTGDEGHWSRRSPALVNVLRLERYEDSLDALELPGETAARRAGQLSFADAPLRYVHEAAAGNASITLRHEQLAHPFACTIPQTNHGAPTLAKVDLLATSLLLLGLHPVRVREMARKDKTAPRYVFVEARPNGNPKELHLLFLRDCNDSLTGEALRKQAEAEMAWLDQTILSEFKRTLSDYAVVWYNRNAVLSSINGRSLDPEVIRRMLERAPLERSA